MDERARIALLTRVLGGDASVAARRGIEVGIGDDAAVLDPAGARRIVWTVDEQVEGVHFRRDLVSWMDLGWRSFMAAASDVAAMGATPWCALAALALPDDVDDAALEGLARGQAEAADAAGAPLVGGNLSRGSTLSIATTLLGTCDRAVSRGGARPGDRLWIAGHVGLAASGFAALTRGLAELPDLRPAVAAWRRPRALVDEGRAMAGLARAAVDVSDGLARDAGHLAEASGVRVVFDEEAVRGDEALSAAARALGVDALELALHGGEDYALVVAGPGPIPGFRALGEVREGQGVWLRSVEGDDERPIEARGFDHFAR
jgi:thiamine-monophosphate kinase